MQRLTVDYHREDGTWWAEVEELPTYSAAADTFAEIRELVKAGIAFALESRDAFSLTERVDGAALQSYVAMPSLPSAGRVVESVFSRVFQLDGSQTREAQPA